MAASAARSFVGSGVIAWIRQPANRIGPLMVATGLALLSRPIWPSASSSVLHTVMLAIDLVGYALVVHVLLAFEHRPPGRHARRRGTDVAQALTVSEVAYGALASVPVGFVVGLMRARLARAGVGDLVVERRGSSRC